MSLKRCNLGGGNYVEMGSNSKEQSDGLDEESKMKEYKEVIYKLFQFQDYKIRGPKGDFTCPFCDCEEKNDYDYSHLLQHAIREDERSLCRKQRAKHSAMAKYLAFDLANHQEDITKESEVVVHKVHQLQRELDEKTYEMNGLIEKERASYDELQGARRRLIKGLEDTLEGDYDNIGIKNMGELDSKVFISEMESRYSRTRGEAIGAMLLKDWQQKLKNPLWHPFLVIDDDKGKPQRLLKEDDFTLQHLKNKWGQKIHDSVVAALHELHEYNPSGRCVVPEIWNFKENRKAKLEEAVEYVFTQLAPQKRKRSATVSASK